MPHQNNVREGIALCYDDVLLVPQMGVLEKRKDADISTRLVGGLRIGVPIISAPMESVTGVDMARSMRFNGGFGILHRSGTVGEHAAAFKKLMPKEEPGMAAYNPGHPDNEAIFNPAGVAIGMKWVGTDPYTPFERLYEAGARIFCIDIAHAHHTVVKDYIENMPHKDGVYLIVGNVATAEGALFLANLGVDGIKVGIGPGAACTTRERTGFGVPQLSAIMEVHKALSIYYDNDRPTIIADGGIRHSGDIVKALAAGADSVMLGRLLAGADESPHPGLYWGMASARVNGHRAPEGIEGTVPRTGPVCDTIKELAWGIRSGVSYAGATNLKELCDNAVFQRVSPLSMTETGTRI
jgi:IMP dehydrogenase